MRIRLVLVLLALLALFTLATPAHAVPIEIVATGLQAPACDWFGRLDLLIEAAQAFPGQLYPTIRPPCADLEARVFFKPGEPSTLFFVAISNPGPPNPDGTPTQIEHARATVPLTSPVEYFSLTFSLDTLPDGRSELWVATGTGISYIFGFTLERPVTGVGDSGLATGPAEPPLEAIPEPATLLLFGTTMAGIGLARWRRRKLKQAAGAH